MSKLENIRKELTALNHEDLSKEIEKMELKGEKITGFYRKYEDLEKEFNDWLSDNAGKVKIMNYTFSANDVLKEVAPKYYLKELKKYVDNIIEKFKGSDKKLTTDQEQMLYDFVDDIYDETID